MKRELRRRLILPLAVSLSFIAGTTWTEFLYPQGVAAQDTTVPTTNVQTLNKLNEDFIEISEQVTPAVVSISITKTAAGPGRRDPNSQDFFDFFGFPRQGERQRSGQGSGVIVDAENGYVLTNNHVVEDASDIRVGLTDNRKFKARVVGTDPRSDLAVIQLENPSNLTEATLGDSSTLHVGEWVLAIGNPFGLDSTVTAGIISAKGRANVGVAEFEDFIQTDAAINPGNSGGALVNIKGELIGINTAIATRSNGYMGIGFAIPSNMAKQVMQSLIQSGQVSRSQLGVYIQAIDEPMVEALQLKSANDGILVSGVIEGSPADKAGFKNYDVITSLGGKKMTDSNQFRNRIALTPPGTQVEIGVLRKGKKMVLKPTLTAAGVNEKQKRQTLSPQAEGNDVEVQNLDAEMRQRLGVEAGVSGVVVTSVRPGSPAYEKGLRPGDVIVEVNRQPVTSPQAYKNVMSTLKSGQTVLMSINRQGGYLVIAYRQP